MLLIFKLIRRNGEITSVIVESVRFFFLNLGEGYLIAYMTLRTALIAIGKCRGFGMSLLIEEYDNSLLAL